MLYEVCNAHFFIIQNRNPYIPHSITLFQVCALRPPFLGDSFPQLKRAIIMGRYSPIPKQYSQPLHSVISKMLKLSPRERPSASSLLNCTEVGPKLALDSATTCFAGGQRENAMVALMSTIKIPGHLNRLKSVLPKPCYPDVRPNSPTSWTVAEQKQHQKKAAPPPLPPVPQSNNNAVDAKENAAPSTIASTKHDNAPAPPAPPVLSAVEAYFARKALVDVSNNKNHHAPPSSRKNRQSPGGYKERNPIYKPVPPTSHAPSAVPSSMRPTAPSTHNRPAGQPSRQHYNARGHRVW